MLFDVRRFAVVTIKCEGKKINIVPKIEPIRPKFPDHR